MYTFYEPEEEVLREPAEEISQSKLSFDNNNLHKSPLESDTETESTNDLYNTGSRKSPCSKNPCQNHGQCWIDKGQSSGFKCVCHPEFSGDKFQMYLAIKLYVPFMYFINLKVLDLDLKDSLTFQENYVSPEQVILRRLEPCWTSVAFHI